MKQDCCSHKTKQRTAEEFKLLIHRLNRIEGQVRGDHSLIAFLVNCDIGKNLRFWD